MQNSRRSLLKILAATPLVACSGNSGAAASFGVVSTGNVSSTSVDALSIVPDAPAILGRDSNGLYAMTITCTHQGCDVAPSGSTLECPCHGSKFDSNGAVLQGPAAAPLVHFAVAVDASGNITVDGRSRSPRIRARPSLNSRLMCSDINATRFLLGGASAGYLAQRWRECNRSR
jgi:nitrite reductase/ring-hydroxylating ferredoxin subunit